MITAMHLHQRIERLLYRSILVHIEAVLALHSTLWGGYLLFKLFDLRSSETFAVLRLLVPGQVLGSALVIVGLVLFIAIIRRSLTWRRRSLWALAHIWLLIAVTTVVANLSSLGALNYLLIAVMHITEYLRIAVVAANDQ
jgi:hypothetical protein